MDYSEFLRKMERIKKMGFVETHRAGDTGIGKTLEDLLGITENNIAGPDFSIYELKSARKESRSMLTLFTKTPQPENAIRVLLEVFGYLQRKRHSNYEQITLTGKKEDISKIPIKDKELHSTIDAGKPNSQGLKLKIAEDKIIVENNKGVEAYWDYQNLRESFNRKYKGLVYILADHKKELGKELFHFDEGYLLHGFSFERFSELVKEGKIKADLRVGHYANGRLHDHGSGFRIFPRYLPNCFEKIEKIL